MVVPGTVLPRDHPCAHSLANQKPRMKRKAAAKWKHYASQKKSKNIINSMPAKAFAKRGPTSNRMLVNMLYADTYTLNPGALGAGATQQFRLGSLHDPDFTGVGHQASGYDYLYSLYERYHVFRVDFEISFVSIDGSNIQGVGYRFNDEDLTDTDPRVNLEGGLGEFSLISSRGGSDRVSYKGTVRNCDIHGVTQKQYMGEQSYGANFGQNPSSDAYLYVYADGNGTDTSGVVARVRLTYHCKLEGSKLDSLS